MDLVGPLVWPYPSMPNAETVFNKDHYGLTDVESRILEFIAVGKFCAALDRSRWQDYPLRLLIHPLLVRRV